MEGWVQANSAQYFFRYIPPHWVCFPSLAEATQDLFLDSDFQGLETGKRRGGGGKRRGGEGGEKTEEEPQAPGPRREEGRCRRGQRGGGGGRREMTKGERKAGELGRSARGVEKNRYRAVFLAAAPGPPET